MSNAISITRSLRLILGMTQTEFGSLFDVSASTVQNVESGRMNSMGLEGNDADVRAALDALQKGLCDVRCFRLAFDFLCRTRMLAPRGAVILAAASTREGADQLDEALATFTKSAALQGNENLFEQGLIVMAELDLNLELGGRTMAASKWLDELLDEQSVMKLGCIGKPREKRRRGPYRQGFEARSA